MANKYVYSGAAGTGTGADWTNAYTTLKAAAEAAGTAAGDNIWVAQDHAETQASALVIGFKNTYAAPGTVICVNRAGSVPPVEADIRSTATVTTTGAFSITITNTAGRTQINGVSFSAGTGATTVGILLSGNSSFALSNLSLIRLGTTAGSIVIGAFNTPGLYVLENVGFGFGNVADFINVMAGADAVLWKNTPTPIVGAIIPTTTLIKGGYRNSVLFSGIDFSQLAGATPIYTFADTDEAIATLVNCTLAASATPFSSVAASPFFTGVLIACDSAATNYRTEKYRYEGAQSVETTIVRTGGATNGTTVISWKVVTTANSKWLLPYEGLPIKIWNDSTTAITVTVYGIWGGGSVPNNDDIWIEVDYFSSASTPISSTVTSGKTDFLTVAGPVASDSSTWGGSTTAFKLVSPSFTPAMKGPLTVRVKAAKATSTFYVDPKPAVTGITVSRSEILAPGVYVNELSTGTSGFVPALRGPF